MMCLFIMIDMKLKILYINVTDEINIYNSNNNEIYWENSNGDLVKSEFDSNNNRIYYEDSNGDWSKQEFDSNNYEIYREDSDGTILDKRPKETKRLTHKAICELIGYNVEIIKEKE